jgi:hypothetical protein
MRGLVIFGLLSILTLLAGRQALAGPEDDLTELKEGGVHSGVEELEVALGVEEQNGITQCEILEPRALRPLTALYCGIQLLPATCGHTGAATINLDIAGLFRAPRGPARDEGAIGKGGEGRRHRPPPLIDRCGA